MANLSNDMDHVLEQKLKACEDFLSATLLLKEALETEEMTAVDHLVGRRQELIRVIDGMDLLIGHYRPDKNKQRLILSEDLKRVLKQIRSANHDCDSIAAGRCEGLRKDLISIRRKEEGFQGYSRSKGKTQKFLNIQA